MASTTELPMEKRRSYRWLVAKLATLFLGLLLIFVVRTLYVAGEFKHLQPHFSGVCQAIHGVVGGEDITIDHARQVAYISADDRFGRAAGSDSAKGAVFVLNFLDRNARPIELTRVPDHPIAPHGISLVPGTDGRQYLYVVDHYATSTSGLGSHRILLYCIQEDHQLQLIKSYEDSRFINSPNDCVGVDEHRFYFTNDHGSTSALGRATEEYLQLRKSNVVYFDGDAYRYAAKAIAMANGINISMDGTELFVASTLGKSILVYDRDLKSGDLTLRTEIDMNTGVDNIERDDRGHLWVGCHPKLLTFVRHSGDISRRSPSQVYKLSRQDDGRFSAQEVFLDDGMQISGSAVAAVSGNILLIGPVLDNRILRCEMATDPKTDNTP